MKYKIYYIEVVDARILGVTWYSFTAGWWFVWIMIQVLPSAIDDGAVSRRSWKGEEKEEEAEY